MRNVSGLILMLGLGQAIFQGYLLFTNGYWSPFVISDFLAELGMSVGYVSNQTARLAADWVLRQELSFSLLALGAAGSLWQPLVQIYDNCQAARTIEQARKRDAERFGSPLATHR